MWAHIVLAIGLIVGCEIVWRYFYTVKSLKGVFAPKVTTNMKKQEFQELLTAGRKLATFEGFVVDMAWYGQDHPGGKFLIDMVVGQDLGKYIYSGYVLDSARVSQHVHSYYAYRILEKIAIARMEEGEEEAYLGVKGNETDIGSFEVSRTDEIAKGVYRIRYQNDKLNAAQFYPGIQNAGQHFTIQSENNWVARNYTICNAMNTALYDKHKEIVCAFAENRPYHETITLDEIMRTNFVELVIKHYPQTQIGISKQMLEPKVQYYFRGPHVSFASSQILGSWTWSFSEFQRCARDLRWRHWRARLY